MSDSKWNPEVKQMEKDVKTLDDLGTRIELAAQEVVKFRNILEGIKGFPEDVIKENKLAAYCTQASYALGSLRGSLIIASQTIERKIIAGPVTKAQLGLGEAAARPGPGKPDKRKPAPNKAPDNVKAKRGRPRKAKVI